MHRFMEQGFGQTQGAIARPFPWHGNKDGERELWIAEADIDIAVVWLYKMESSYENTDRRQQRRNLTQNIKPLLDKTQHIGTNNLVLFIESDLRTQVF